MKKYMLTASDSELRQAAETAEDLLIRLRRNMWISEFHRNFQPMQHAFLWLVLGEKGIQEMHLLTVGTL